MRRFAIRAISSASRNLRWRSRSEMCLAAQPRAVWFTEGTPAQVQESVDRTMRLAKAERRVPVLVLYYTPGRDCSFLSAGGAPNTAAYKAWIDGVVRAIGSDKAVVILEPDSLGLLPETNCLGEPERGLTPATYPFTDQQRFDELRYASAKLGALPSTLVYLDATHSAWLAVPDAAIRLARTLEPEGTPVPNPVTANLAAMRPDWNAVQGFYLNVSNFRVTNDLTRYGTWISKCVAFATNPDEGGWRLGHYDWCASQYFSPLGAVNPNDPTTWHFTDQWFDANLGTARPTVRFVIDTSRNGRGPWVPPNPPYANVGVAQDWCNPPGRGLGPRATANTGVPLVDAFLWIKVPGESDGTCTRGRPPGSVDPEWNVVDPAAGEWFRQQALQLAQLANPPLRR